MQKRFCDSCDKELIVNSVGSSWKDYESERCDLTHHGEFHKACLTAVFGSLYCKVHAQVAENRQVVVNYVAKIWTDMGYIGAVNDRNGTVSSTVGPLNMEIIPEYDPDAVRLSTVDLKVTGLTSKTRLFKASLCEHETVVKQLQGAIVRSLRSTKSSITQKKKQMDEEVAKMDLLITELMAKLGGEMPDDTSITE
jgi:hypothetical protein